MATADDERGRELAELARHFLLWIRHNDLPGAPGLRGALPDHFEIHAGVYRRLERSHKLLPNLWSGDPAEQKRLQGLRLGITHVLLLNNPTDLVKLPDGRELERNRIVPAGRGASLETSGSMIAVSPSLDGMKADDATLGRVRNYDFSAILQRVDLVHDDASAAAAGHFRYPFIFDYDTPRRAYDAHVQDILVPTEIQPKPGSNRYDEILAKNVREFREHLYHNATYANRRLIKQKGGGYYEKWKDPRRRQFRPTLLTDAFLKECFTEFVMKRGDDLLLIDLPEKRLLYRLLWEPPKRTEAAPFRFVVQPLLTIAGGAGPPARKLRGKDDDPGPSDSGLRFPVTAAIFHALDGGDELPTRFRFGKLEYAGGPARRFVVDYKAYLRWHYGDKRLDLGGDREWFDRFVEVFFGDRSYPLELSLTVPGVDREALFLAAIRREASQAVGPLKAQLAALVAWCEGDPGRYVFTQGMKFGSEAKPRELIGVTLGKHVFEWHPQTELVTTMEIGDWLADFRDGELFGEIARNTAGMLPFITLVTWGGTIVMGGGVFGGMSAMSRLVVPELVKNQVGKFVSKEAIRKARPQLVAILVDGLLMLMPTSDHAAYQFLRGLFEGFGGGAVEHYLSEVDDRLEKQVKKIPAIAANIATKGAYRVYAIYEKVSVAADKIAVVVQSLKLVLTDERAKLAAQQLGRLGQYAGAAFLIILFVVVYLDYVYRKHKPNEVTAWVEKQKKTLVFMIQETGDEIAAYAGKLQDELRALRKGASGSQASTAEARAAVRRHDDDLAQAVRGKLKDGFDRVPAVADFLQLLLHEMGVDNWDELKSLGFGELMSRGFDALPKKALASDQARKLGAALGELVGTIMMERQIVPKSVRQKGGLFGHPQHQAAKGALAGGTWRALWRFAIYPFRNLGEMPETLKRGLEEQAGRHDSPFSAAQHRDTAYRDMIRDLIGDEDELARRLIRLAEDEGLKAKLDRLVQSAKADLVPPDLEALTKGDNPDWPTDAIMFVLYTWLRLGLREILLGFRLIEDDAPYAGQFRLSQLLDIIGLDVALDDRTVAALKARFSEAAAP